MASLPLLALPYPLLHNVISRLNIIELIELSFTSTQCRQIVRRYARIAKRIVTFDVMNAKTSYVQIQVDDVTVTFRVHSSIRDDESALQFIDAKELNKPRKVFEKLPFDARKLNPKWIIDFWRNSNCEKEFSGKSVILTCYVANKEQTVVEIAHYLIGIFGKPVKTFSIFPEHVKHLEPLLTSTAFRTSFSRRIISSCSKKKLTSQEMTWILEAPRSCRMELQVQPHRSFELCGYLHTHHLTILKRAAAWVTPQMLFESFRHCEVIGLARVALVREEHLNQIVKRWLAGFDRLKDIVVIGEKPFDVRKIDEGLCYFKSIFLSNIEVQLVRRADGRVAGVARTVRSFKFKALLKGQRFC